MAGTSSRGNPRLGDVLRTVGVLGGVVLLLWGVGQLFTVTPETPTRAVDYRTAAEDASRAAPYPLLVPTDLPQGWRATAARFERPAAWHLGVVTGADEYVGVEQDVAAVDDLVERFAQDSRPVGSVDVAGRTWSERRDPDGAVVLVRSDGDAAALVLGATDRATVLEYVASLETP